MDTKPYNFEKDVTSRERLALLLFPGRDATLRHGRAHGWHAELGKRMSSRGDVKTWQTQTCREYVLGRACAATYDLRRPRE